MKWFSNLRIGNRLFLVFSLEIVFLAALFSAACICLSKMKNMAIEANPQSAAAISGSFTSFIVTALVLSLIFVLLIVYFTTITIKSIVGPIELLSKSAVLISEGTVAGSLSSNRQDEIGQLARDMDKVLLVLQSLNDDIRKFSDSHHITGDVYAKIDADKYDGAYKESMEGLNEMLWQYIADARDVLYCISEFTNGNFNTQVRSFPGTRAVANNISYGLRNALASLSKEVTEAVSAAADGNFEVRVDEAKYKGEWNLTAREINRLLDSIAEPIRETTDAMLEIYEGNLKPEIKGGFRGDFALVKTSASNAVESVFNNIKEISSALTELSNKRFDVEIKGDFAGDYAEAKAAIGVLSETMKELISQISEAAENIDADAERLAEVIEKAPSYDEGAKSDNDKIPQLLSSFAEDGGIVEGMSKLVEIIEDIAHQTNLLVMLASVEVARAGEHGKGFALVTEELRNLVERNQDAVGEAEQLVNSAKQALREEAGKVNDAVNEALNASKENETLSIMLNEISGIPYNMREQSEALKRAAAGYGERP